MRSKRKLDMVTRYCSKGNHRYPKNFTFLSREVDANKDIFYYSYSDLPTTKNNCEKNVFFQEG